MLRRSAVPFLTCLSLIVANKISAQENSPYSRYGLGNTVPNTNIVNRGMGGISAAYADPFSVNFNNPASYSAFQAQLEQGSRKLQYGRVLLDAGLNIENKALREPNNIGTFSNTNVLFSYFQLGIPLRKNWGLSFGLRPLHRIAYKLNRYEMLKDPSTGDNIDSALTQFSGNGGTFLPSIGTGFAIKNFSIGVNAGYLFGRKEYSSSRVILDTAFDYTSTVYNTNASYGGLFLMGGAQYKFKFSEKTSLTLGVSGNLKKELSASRDVTRQALTAVVDTVYSETDVKGSIIYPASYTAGLAFERQTGKGGSVLVAADLLQNNWQDYRFFGAVDSVQDNWQFRFGGHVRPDPKPGRYFSNVIYRAGFFFGPDYIRLSNKVPIYGLSFGLGLPLANYNRLSPGQFTVINLALEYEKRGNNENALKENMFRFSIGLNFSDLWFNKRKYD